MNSSEELSPLALAVQIAQLVAEAEEVGAKDLEEQGRELLKNLRAGVDVSPVAIAELRAGLKKKLDCREEIAPAIETVTTCEVEAAGKGRI
jgi:hypothetical protein